MIPTGRTGPPISRRRRGRLVAVVAGLMTVAAACSAAPSSTPSASNTARTTESPPASDSASPSTGGAVTSTTLDAGRVVAAPSTPTTVPHERGVRPINPTVDNGQQILITSSGFVPAQLFADVTKPVVWTNLSGTTQQVIFDVFPVHSPPIPPGAQFIWQPSTTVDIGYHSASGTKGALILQAHQPG